MADEQDEKQGQPRQPAGPAPQDAPPRRGGDDGGEAVPHDPE
jgi:hypothetical protein